MLGVDPVNKNTISKIHEDTKNAVGLPNEFYCSEKVLKLERREIFAKNWIPVCLVEDVQGPGDVKPICIGGFELLVARDLDGTLRVFHNVCRHRGTTLMEEPKCGVKRIMCPYHGWTYGLDGTLVRTPHFSGFGEHDHNHLNVTGLLEVRSDVWAHVVFVNLTESSPSLAQWVAPIEEFWKGYDLSDVHWGGGMVFDMPANWKLVLENFLESYHLPFVHADLNKYSPLRDHNLVIENNFMGQRTKNYTPKDDGAQDLPRFPMLSKDMQISADYLLLFPNLMVSCAPDHFRVTLVDPIATNRTIQRWEFFFVGEESTQERFEHARNAVVERIRRVNLEDKELLKRVQRGRESVGFDGGRFSPAHERTTHNFQKMVASHLESRL